METVGGDGSETGLVMKGKQKSTTSLGASLTTDYRDKEESNNNRDVIRLHVDIELTEQDERGSSTV